MTLSLDTVEKYAWTIFDFLILRPQRFYQIRSRDRNRYMDPLPFALVNFFTHYAVLVAAIKLLSPILDWRYVVGYRLGVAMDTSLIDIIAIIGPVYVLSQALGAGFIMLATRLVGKRILVRDLVVSTCYSTATSLFLVIYIGVAAYIILILNANGKSVNVLAHTLYYVYFLPAILSLPYYISSAANISNTSFRRLLLGYFIAYIVVVDALFILQFLVVTIYSILLGG